MSFRPRQLDRAVRLAAWFAWRRTKQPKEWGRYLFWAWLSFHGSNGFAVTLHNEDGSVCAFFIARPVMHPEDGSDSYAFDHEGRGYYIDFLITQNHEVTQLLLLHLVQRMGQREFIAYRRPDNRLRVMPMATYSRHLLRKKTHALK